MTDGVIAQLDIARTALAEAKTIQETKKILDIASAAEIYARRQQLGDEAISYATSIKVEALAQLGRMLRDTPRNKGGNIETLKYASTSTKLAPVDEPPTLADLGLDKKTSKLAQDIAELPEDQLELVKTGVITLAKAQQKQRKEDRQAERSSMVLPAGVFNVIYADPPWQYDNAIESWGPASLHYQSLPLNDIAHLRDSSGLRVQEKFADNAVLFLWVTNPFLRDAFQVIDAWGFDYKTNIVWVKRSLKRPGSGFYVRGRHELLFICTRGSFVPNQTGKEPIGSVLECDLQEHSSKPEEVYRIIESLYPEGRYLELFARNKRERWESWGDQIKAVT